MSWPSLDSWRQSIFDQEDIVAIKVLNKKKTVWLTRFQGRQVVFKMTPDRSARHNQAVCLNAFSTLRRSTGKSHFRVYVPAIFAPLGEAEIVQGGVSTTYSAFLMDYHCGDPLDVLIDQLVEFSHEASIELVVEIAICVENVARMLAELGRTPKQGAVPDLKDTLLDLESGQTTLLDYTSGRTRQMALDVLFKWLERLQELCGLHKLTPVDELDKNKPPTDFDYCARLASAFKLDLQQASRQRMRKILLGKRMKDIRRANKHWNSPLQPQSPAEQSRPTTPLDFGQSAHPHAHFERYPGAADGAAAAAGGPTAPMSWPGSPRPRSRKAQSPSMFSESTSSSSEAHTESSDSTVMADRSQAGTSSWDSM